MNNITCLLCESPHSPMTKDETLVLCDHCMDDIERGWDPEEEADPRPPEHVTLGNPFLSSAARFEFVREARRAATEHRQAELQLKLFPNRCCHCYGIAGVIYPDGACGACTTTEPGAGGKLTFG